MNAQFHDSLSDRLYVTGKAARESVNPRSNDEAWVVNQVSDSISIVSVSRGLVTAPYAAALMIAEAGLAPFERDIAEAIHPARFFIRDLKRSQKIAAK